MGTYRVEWPCCGSVTETQAWEPERCPFCEPDTNAPADPALLALAKFGADVIGSNRTPSGIWSQPTLASLLDIARHRSVIDAGGLAPGIAAAIDRLLDQDGADGAEEVTP